ncbi:hypothetical protein [Oricola cellulosilytica]|uniref:Uncharacterized protein n=1 Tax=Oricola cellulosilytica TaxID=1429082 RepID=A0A4V2MNX1_9HYPH|nr:hypothetical protein [Oricola cellulosilytica]TCD15077.1 hypothetical protein E0D97_05890 [Oricola cellulosilytica]
MPEEKVTNIDRQNREIEQMAQTDTDLETVVPPRWGPASWWRIGVAILGVLIIAVVIFRAL